MFLVKLFLWEWVCLELLLNEAIVCLHEIIPQFKKENKLQKVQCVILTDGEAPPVKYHKTVQRHWESEPYLGVRSLNLLCRLRNRKTGKTYTFSEEWWNCTNTFLRDIRDTMPDVNFIGIRVLLLVMLDLSFVCIIRSILPNMQI